MNNSNSREYKINIDPRILELLGPSLYTNIYYVLAELIANAYDANAHNVYIIEKNNQIIVEDDGFGMSYKDGDVAKYLNVAVETRTTGKDIYVEGSNRKRKRIGRKGIGKLAALSVSDRVLIKTIKNGEKSGFVLSRHVGRDHKLEPLSEQDIKFEKGNIKNGTSVVMTNPQYDLHKTPLAIKNNLLKIFPLVNRDFKIHIKTGNTSILIESFDAEIIVGLGALITLSKEFQYLARYFNPAVPKRATASQKLLKKENAITIPLKLKNRNGESKNYDLEIKGWIGAYRTTKDRKMDRNDFPDNFISLLSNGKLGEYNILSIVGKNKLPEVYVVGQLHVNLFEETELPDMALSNRQGYKSDDPRYVAVIKYVSDKLLPEIVNMRNVWGDYNREEKDKAKEERQRKMEAELREKVENYKTKVSNKAAEKIAGRSKNKKDIKEIIHRELNALLPIVGLKKRIDSQKKRILISHTGSDKPLADVICKMLVFNNVPYDDIIYTSSDNGESRIPEGENIFDYLRQFFVDSYSNEKIFVIYVTSDDMARSWFAVTEVGAGWITKSTHKVFNIHNHRPQRPLDTDIEWQTSKVSGDAITMSNGEFDKFIVKILDICKRLGYKARSKKENGIELRRYVSVV
jgi:hypothetical protein